MCTEFLYRYCASASIRILAIFYVVHVILGSEQKEPFKLFEPCLWKSINRSALVSFLLANLMTGFVNLNFRTLDADNVQCLTIMLIYSFLVCALVFVQYVRIWKNEQRLKGEWYIIVLSIRLSVTTIVIFDSNIIKSCGIGLSFLSLSIAKIKYTYILDILQTFYVQGAS